MYVGIKIQWLTSIAQVMTIVLLLLHHILAFSQSAPQPDTHLHFYLPPEGNSFLCFFLICFSKEGETRKTGGGFAAYDLR